MPEAAFPMLRDCWLPLCAAAGLALAVPVHAQPKGTSDHHQTNAEQSHNQRAEKPEQAIPPVVQSYIERIAGALEAANAHEGSPKKNDYAEDDLQAQKTMADSASRMFWVAVGDTALTLVGIILLGLTLAAAWASARHTKRTADAAEGSFTKLERPHLFVESPRLDRNTRMRFNPHIPTHWIGDPPGFEVAYDILNYGRSPAIIKERSATVFIGAELPSIPAVNQNDVFTDLVAIKSEGAREGWTAFYRGNLTDEMIEMLRVAQATPDAHGLRAYLFVRLRYEGVYGKVDEIGAIWEYHIDADVFDPCEIENYNYRKLGD